MIVIYHKGNKVSNVSIHGVFLTKLEAGNIAACFYEMAREYPEDIIVWCHSDLQSDLNISIIPPLFNHPRKLFSYHISDENFLGSRIGYVEESVFIKINKSVRFPTWQMGSDVGAVSAAVLNACVDSINADENFDYFLVSLAKKAMPNGLLCYSEPALLTRKNVNNNTQEAGINTLFRFVKEHYKTRWIFLLFLNLLVYEKKWAFLPFLKALTYKKCTFNSKKLHVILPNSLAIPENITIDVVIPTIGRKKYLKDTLDDLAKQSICPVNVIIVEQNAETASVSELDYITNENWPFTIKHIFTHQCGACNARNLALNQITSEWVFFADDDIRMEPEFMQTAFQNIIDFGAEAVSVACCQKGEKPKHHTILQPVFFSSGCSLVRSEKLKGLEFSMGYEFGFGEDSDFGMQLRNIGCDVLYLPKPQILHLKAPVGGFRTQPQLAWKNEKYQPKPSPTLMLYFLRHYTIQQLNGYKTNLFIKYYKHQSIRNPLHYFNTFKKQWNVSVLWANQLAKK